MIVTKIEPVLPHELYLINNKNIHTKLTYADKITLDNTLTIVVLGEHRGNPWLTRSVEYYLTRGEFVYPRKCLDFSKIGDTFNPGSGILMGEDIYRAVPTLEWLCEGA